VLELREAQGRAAPAPSPQAPPRPAQPAQQQQARGLPDPLQGVTPAMRIGTLRTQATGSLKQAAALERLASGGAQGAAGAPAEGDARRVEMQTKLESAVREAAETCAEGPGAAAECAAAWDEVEELSAHASRKKQGDRASE